MVVRRKKWVGESFQGDGGWRHGNIDANLKTILNGHLQEDSRGEQDSKQEEGSTDSRGAEIPLPNDRVH